jgi:hypothetical protein
MPFHLCFNECEVWFLIPSTFGRKIMEVEREVEKLKNGPA